MAALFIALTILNIVYLINSQDLFYEGTAEEYDQCNITTDLNGDCRFSKDCPQLFEGEFKDYFKKICGFTSNLQPLICCPRTPPLTRGECGKRGFVTIDTSTKDTLLRKRSAFTEIAVVGGSESGHVRNEPSLRQTWPWMVLLGKGKLLTGTRTPNFFCNGALINGRFILTAAHCLYETEEFFVRLSEHNYNLPNDGPAPLDIEVESIFVHPKYNFSLGYNDLALIKMAKNVNFTDAVKPICLPWNKASNLEFVDTTATLTGWGAKIFGGRPSPSLQEVEVKIFHPSQCEKQYSVLPDFTSLFPHGMTIDNVICAGDTQGGKDACQGDSGAPLVQHDNGHFTLAGIVSKGYGCGHEDFLGLYAPIRSQETMQWIKDIAF